MSNQEHFEKFMLTLSQKAKRELRRLGLKISDSVELYISTYSIEILVDGKVNSITYYATQNDILGKFDAKINYGTSGSFNPMSDPIATEKAHLVSELLRYWPNVVLTLDEICKERINYSY